MLRRLVFSKMCLCGDLKILGGGRRLALGRDVAGLMDAGSRTGRRKVGEKEEMEGEVFVVEIDEMTTYGGLLKISWQIRCQEGDEK